MHSKSYDAGFKHGMIGLTDAYKPGNRKPGSDSFLDYSKGFEDGFYRAGEEKRRPGQVNYGRKNNPAKRQAFPNVATATRALKQAEKALADNPNMWPGAAAGFKTVITKANKYLAENSQTHKTNPAPRKRALSRPSQITKKAPSKRLVARRKLAAKKPVKGYFPNPAKKPAPHSALPYCVQLEYEGRGWKTVAAFAAQIPAENHAHGIAKKFPDGPSIRVIKK